MVVLQDVINYSAFLTHGKDPNDKYWLTVKGNLADATNVNYAEVYPLLFFQHMAAPTDIDNYSNYVGVIRFGDLANHLFAGIFAHSLTMPALDFDCYNNINGFLYSANDTLQHLLFLSPNVTGEYYLDYADGVTSLPVYNTENPVSLRNNRYQLLIDTYSIGPTITQIQGLLQGIKLNENNNISTQQMLYSASYAVTDTSNHYEYTWIDGTVVDIVLPVGNYTLTSLTTYIKNLMITNKHCPLDALGAPVTIFEFFSPTNLTGFAATRVHFIPSASTKKTWTIPTGATWTWPAYDKFPQFQVYGNNNLLGIGFGGYQWPQDTAVNSNPTPTSTANGTYSYFDNYNDIPPLIGGVYLGLSSESLLLNKTTLGSSVVNSSLTSVGTLTSLTVSGSITGTLATAAQPNVTSVGTLTDLTVTGTATAGNVNSTGVYRIGGVDFVASRNTDAVALGRSAGLSAQQVYAIAIGVQAGQGNQAASAVAVGSLAGNSSQGSSSVAVGANAGRYTQGGNAVAIGNNAGTGTTTAGTGQGSNAVAVGNQAGQDTQSSNAVAVGNGAGNNTQGGSAVAVGLNAGQTTQGGSTVAVGVNAGRYTQGGTAVAIGSSAGSGTTTAGTGQGSNAVAVGTQSGAETQGASSVAVGPNAGRYTQAASAVAIGNQAGQGTTTAGTGQGGSAVAIGNAAGLDTQASNAVAIGTSAGRNIQGSNAVAIGRLAGETSQHANSIILNGSGAALNSDGSSRFYVKPVRQDTTVTTLVGYNSTSGEITYGAVPAAPAISSFWLATNTQITTSNVVQNLGSITLAAGTYLLQVYGQASGTGLTRTEISLDPTSTVISNNRKNGYPYDNRFQNIDFQYLQATTVITLASSTTLYLNGRAVSTQLGVNFTCWVANDTGVTATKLG